MSDRVLELVLQALADEESLHDDNARLRRLAADQARHIDALTRDLDRLRVIVANREAEIRRLTTTQETP